MTEHVRNQMTAHGFKQVTDRGGYPIDGLFSRVENPVVYCILFTENDEVPEFFAQYAHGLEEMLPRLHCTHLVKLCIHTKEEFAISPEAYSETAHAIYWWYDVAHNRIVPRAGDPSKLIGIEKLLLQTQNGEATEKLEMGMAKEDKPVVCLHIFVVCLLAFLGTMFLDDGGLMIRTFALQRSGILSGEIYRFVTAMFLHGGWLHFFSNSVMLYYFGTQMERILGHKKFLLTYLFCGLTCGIASILWNDVYSVGASGGLFGLMMMALLYTKKYGELGRGRMNHSTLLFFVIYSLAMGFTNTTTDNLGHLGGLLGGLLVYALLERRKGS